MRNSPEGRRKWPGHNLIPLIRVGVAGGIFTAVGIFIQACGKGGATSISQGATHTTNNPATGIRAWLTEKANYQGDYESNGLRCVIEVSKYPRHEHQVPPIAVVSFEMKSQRTIRSWDGDPSTYLRIKLLDKDGRPVERTEEGKKFAELLPLIPLTEQITERYRGWTSGKYRTDGFYPGAPSSSFSIPELFEVNQPGEYTLVVEMRLVEQVGMQGPNPSLRFMVLPEVSGKIHLLSQEGRKP